MQRAKQIIAVAGLLIFGSQSWASTQEAFLKMIDRPRVPLAAEVTQLPDIDGFEQLRFTYAADSSNRVPGILIRKKALSGKHAVVIALHGTGGKKEGEIPLLKQLAGKGFVAVAIDARYHGERSKAGSGSADYQQAMLRTWRTGEEHPFLYDTVWDTMRLIDYLVSRPDVDAARIGIYGTSKGGMEVYLAAAVDPRISAAVPCIGVQSFRWALDNESWQSRAGTFQVALNTAAKDAGAQVDAAFLRKFYDRVAPGVYSDYDGPAMLPLIAPRPLLAINGDSDARTPGPGLTECINAAKKAYAKAGASDKFESILEPNTAHKVTAEARETAVEWLAKWLKP